MATGKPHVNCVSFLAASPAYHLQTSSYPVFLTSELLLRTLTDSPLPKVFLVSNSCVQPWVLHESFVLDCLVLLGISPYWPLLFLFFKHNLVQTPPSSLSTQITTSVPFFDSPLHCLPLSLFTVHIRCLCKNASVIFPCIYPLLPFPATGMNELGFWRIPDPLRNSSHNQMIISNMLKRALDDKKWSGLYSFGCAVWYVGS